MNFIGKRYLDYASFIKLTFGERVQKIALDIGFSCPNRDGSKGFGGCTYCNNETFNPDYCEPTKSISQQLVAISQMKAVLNRITFNNSSNIIHLGSLIITDKGNYYLGISAGKITINSTDYFAISASSPIGKQLIGKKVGNVIAFNQAKILQLI